MDNMQLKQQLDVLKQINNLGLGSIQVDSIKNINNQFTNQIFGVIKTFVDSNISQTFDIWKNSANPELDKMYSISKTMAKVLQENFFQNGYLEDINKSIAGISRIFDTISGEQFIETISRISDILKNNSDYFDNFNEDFSDEDFEDCAINEDGSLSCAGEIICKEEIRDRIIGFLINLIDNIEEAKTNFKNNHKIICFVIGIYSLICSLEGIPLLEPPVSLAYSMVNKLNNSAIRYCVCKELVKVYDAPTCKAKIIYRASCKDTIILEESCKRWIKVAIPVKEEVYHGWVAKCNLLRYDNENLNEDELKYEVE